MEKKKKCQRCKRLVHMMAAGILKQNSSGAWIPSHLVDVCPKCDYQQMEEEKIISSSPMLPAADVRWLPRYSSTMEDDKQGRWARVAYAGKFDNIGFYRGKVCRWEVAWVKKLNIKGELKFTVSYLYPSNGKHLFDSVAEAQKEVDKTFRWFVKMCVGKIGCR